MKRRLGYAAVPPIALALFAVLALAACGGPKGRPTLPPPEYEEPTPPVSAVPAPASAPSAAPAVVPAPAAPAAADAGAG